MPLGFKSLLRLVKSLTLGLLLAAALGANAFADCATDNPPTCSYVPFNMSVSVTPTAFGTASPVCEKVYDGCAADIMVPTGSQAEWTSFVQYHEACASLSNCQTPLCSPSSVANGSVGAYPGCAISCDAGYTLNGSTCVASACNPSTVANGSVDPSTCAITCDTDYTLSNGTCQASVVQVCNLTAGGHGVNGGGTIWACVCGYYYNTPPSYTNPYTGPVSGNVPEINNCSGQPVCGSGVTVNSDGSTSGTLCAAGAASAVSAVNGTYTCGMQNTNSENGWSSISCQAQTVIPGCLAGTDGYWCSAGTMTHYDESGTNPENWHCTGINAPDALCVKYGIQPVQ